MCIGRQLGARQVRGLEESISLLASFEMLGKTIVSSAADTGGVEEDICGCFAPIITEDEKR